MKTITKDQISEIGTDKSSFRQVCRENGKKQLVTGPVSSLRFGRCLEINLLPFKMCTFNCIYCELGQTPLKTIECKKLISPDRIITELKTKLPTKPDYITISGSGEPTLYLEMRELIERIRMLTDIPVAVITNGSLLWNKEVRKSLSNAQLVAASLDSASDLMFQTINRPHTDISFDQLIKGLTSFRHEYSGKYWLEIMLIAGYTAIPSEISKLSALIKKIRPDKVQLNTITAPPAENYAQSVDKKRLHELAALFDPRAEVIADFDRTNNIPKYGINNNVVINPEMKGDHYARI